MKSQFDSDQDQYSGDLSPENKYQKAAQVWDSRIGEARVQASNWRMMALMLGALSLILAIFLGVVAANKQVEAFVVPVDNIGRVGQVRLLGDKYEPSKAEVGYFLGEFIKKIRSKSIDPVVMRKNWTEAYNYISIEAAAKLNEYALEEKPLENIGDDARSVEIESIVQRSPDTYQIAWQEKKFTKGQARGVSNFTGIFTVSVDMPSTAEDVFKNPLGIKIKSMTWDQEFKR